MNRLVTWRYEFAIIAAWFLGSDFGLTTSLTIYGFGLRGNSANESIGKHRFRTKKHQKVNKSSQKTMAYLFGTMRSQVRVLSLRPKNSQKQAILTCFRLFFYLFFTKSAIFGWPHVCPDFEPLDCFSTVVFPLFQKIPFLCFLRCKFWGLTVFFCQPSFLSSRQIGICLIAWFYRHTI